MDCKIKYWGFIALSIINSTKLKTWDLAFKSRDFGGGNFHMNIGV